MRPSSPKVSFDPGFFVAKKILSLVVLFCFLVFFSLAYADGPDNLDDPVGAEHPWDELRSEPDHQALKPPEISSVQILPRGSFGGWIIIHFPQAKDQVVEKDRGQIHSSDKNQCRFFIFF